MRLLAAVLVVNIVVTTALTLLGQRDASWWSGHVGPFVIMVVFGAHIVAFDSRARWPDAPWPVRLFRLMTFHR